MGKSAKNNDSPASTEAPVVNLKNRRITASMGATVNLGDYQSQRIELGLSADIDDGISFEDGIGNILDYVEGQLQYEIEGVLTKGNIIERAKIDIRGRTGRSPKKR